MSMHVVTMQRAMGILGDVARTAVVAGTWTAVSNRVSRRQAGRWAAENQTTTEQSKPNPYMPPPPGRYQRAMFQPHRPPPPPATLPAAQPAPPPPPPANAMTAKLAQLQQLGDLKAQGIITEEEFQTQKDTILSV